jgi:DNA-binding CsgD family transcriptional regulator
MVFEALNDLTPRVRRAIELRELNERSTEETARIMGISVGAVKARVFHGRKKLRDALKHYFGSPWTSPEAALHERPVTRHISRKTRLPAMAVVEARNERST